MNNNDNNRVNDQIKQQQINNQLEQQSNLSKGMAPYQHYKKTHVKSSINDNKRMKNQLNSVSRKGSSSLGGLGGTVNRGVNAAKDYKNASTVKDKEKAKSQMKGSVANGVVTAATGSSTLGNLAEKAVKMKDKLNPLKAAKNAILGKINGDEEEQYDELGNPKQQENRLENVSFTIPPKVIKWTLIAGLPSFVAIIFIVLFVTASQTYINILGIDSADKVTEEQLESKDDTWHEEGEGSNDPDKVETYNFKNNKELLVDSFIEESSNVNIVLLANERTHEADLGDINDYFSKKLKCEGDKCQEEPEYLFYLKMHDIYYLYKIKYKVILDLPLLMSALSIGDEEIVNIFEMNSKNFTLKDHENNLDYIKKCQEGNCPSDILNIDPAYDFKNLDGYLYLSSSDFSYDMQILAQNMVVRNGDSYKKDLNHFDEFLDQYIEYKYYLSDAKKKEIYDKEKNHQNNSAAITNGKYIENVFYKKVYYYSQADYSQYRMSNTCSADHTIATSGCGPTSMAIIISTFKQENHDPVELTEKAVKEGAYVCGNGSSIAPMVSILKSYGFNAKSTTDKEEVRKALKDGKSLVIANMGPGTFTNGGHYIVLVSMNDSEEVFVADPSSRGRDKGYNKYWSFDGIVASQVSYGYIIVTE